MKKKIIFIIAMIVVAIVLIAGIIYASMLADEKYQEKANEPLLGEDITLEDFTNETGGLIFSIQRTDTTDCTPVVLEVYNDGTYLYADKQAPTEELEGYSIPVYSSATEGTYEYDVLDIFLNLKQASEKYYTITTGTYETYMTDKNNEALMDFLDTINVDLDACMSVDTE